MSNDVAIKDMSDDALKNFFMKKCSSRIDQIEVKSIDYVDCLVFKYKEGDERHKPINEIRLMNQSRLDSFITAINEAHH